MPLNLAQPTGEAKCGSLHHLNRRKGDFFHSDNSSNVVRFLLCSYGHADVNRYFQNVADRPVRNPSSFGCNLSHIVIHLKGLWRMPQPFINVNSQLQNNHVHMDSPPISPLNFVGTDISGHNFQVEDECRSTQSRIVETKR
jgi:hypothetical protein